MSRAANPVRPREVMRPLRNLRFEPEKEHAVGERYSTAGGAQAPRSQSRH
jgi:hypothetical protein